jgi:hypothetical protein
LYGYGGLANRSNIFSKASFTISNRVLSWPGPASPNAPLTSLLMLPEQSKMNIKLLFFSRSPWTVIVGLVGIFAAQRMSRPFAVFT